MPQCCPALWHVASCIRGWSFYFWVQRYIYFCMFRLLVLYVVCAKIHYIFSSYTWHQSLANHIFFLSLNSMNWNGTDFFFLFFVPSVTASSSDHQRNWRQTLQKKDLKTDTGWKTRSCPFLKQPVKTYISPIKENLSRNEVDSEKTVPDLKPEVCAYSTALTKHTSQRCS